MPLTIAWRAARVACLLAAAAQSGAAASAQAPSSLRLRDAIAEALRSSPLLDEAHDVVANARIQRELAESRFGVRVSPNIMTGTAPAGLATQLLGVDVAKKLPFGADVAASVTSVSYGMGSGADALRDLGYTIGVSQPLLRGAGLAASNDLKTARRLVVTSERAIDDARQQLIVTVADRYFAVLRQQRLVDAGRRASDRAKAFSAASQARAGVGLATQLDVLRADLLQSQAELELASHREALASAVEDLNLALGRPPGRPIDVEDVDLSDQGLAAAGLQLPPDGDRSLEWLVAGALAARTEIRESRDRIDDARRAVRVSTWNLLPQISVDASYTKRGLGAGAMPTFPQALNGWRLGLSTNYALDRSDQMAAAGHAGVSLRAAERAAADTERRVEADVRRSYRAWLAARETIVIQRKSVDLAEKQLRLAQLRFDRGLASSFDVVDAEANLYQTQSALIGAEVERAMAALALGRATGTLRSDRFLDDAGVGRASDPEARGRPDTP